MLVRKPILPKKYTESIEQLKLPVMGPFSALTSSVPTVFLL